MCHVVYDVFSFSDLQRRKDEGSPSRLMDYNPLPPMQRREFRRFYLGSHVSNPLRDFFIFDNMPLAPSSFQK
jgi:hypothetical protein